MLREILSAEGRKQIKGVLRMQSIVAGIGNAYSDEILHAARMSPYKPANGLDDGELQTLYDAIRGTLADAVARSSGLAASELKGEKKSNLAVHGRTGQKLPGVRRRGARGVLRRLEPAVLRDVPDRREAAGGPADEQAAEVGPGHGEVPVGPTPVEPDRHLVVNFTLTTGSCHAVAPVSPDFLRESRPGRLAGDAEGAADLGPGDVARCAAGRPIPGRRRVLLRRGSGSCGSVASTSASLIAPTAWCPRAAA